MKIGANDLLAFALELAMLAVLGWWGFTRGAGPIAATLMGLGAPLIAALAWAAFASPRAMIVLPALAVLGIKLLLFGAAATALAQLGHRGWAAGFAIVVVVNLGVALSHAH